MKTIIIDGVEYNLTPKVAFREGDWVIDKQGIVHQIANVIENVTNHTYAYDIVGGGYFNDNTEGVRLWTIQDAKDGDVLVDQNGEMPFIFKECKNNHVYCYCGYTNRKDVFFDKFVDNKNEELHWLNLYHEQAYPATKEQRDTLIKAMADAGYEWNAEKKELKKIESITTWSEEDEEIHRKCICAMRASACGFPEEEKFVEQVDNWLKSLKERVQSQNTITDEELAQAKKDAYNDVLDKIEYDSENPTFDDGWSAAIWYLKKRNLLPQNVWKPSDEQIKALSYYLKNDIDNEGVFGRQLVKLYQDLLKLREE